MLASAFGLFHGVAAQAAGAVAAAVPAPSAPSIPAGWRLAGSGTFRWWGLAVYDAALWVAPGFAADAPERSAFVLELHYRRALAGADIAQRSLQEMRRLDPLTAEQAQRWLAAMQTAFPDVRAGDRLAGWYRPGQGATFYANGRLTAEVADAEFARRFFAIWLSARSAAPELRAALLGLASPSPLAAGEGG